MRYGRGLGIVCAIMTTIVLGWWAASAPPSPAAMCTKVGTAMVACGSMMYVAMDDTLRKVCPQMGQCQQGEDGLACVLRALDEPTFAPALTGDMRHAMRIMMLALAGAESDAQVPSLLDAVTTWIRERIAFERQRKRLQSY